MNIDKRVLFVNYSSPPPPTGGPRILASINQRLIALWSTFHGIGALPHLGKSSVLYANLFRSALASWLAKYVPRNGYNSSGLMCRVCW